MKKTLKVLLALLLVFSLVTPAAFAAEEPENAVINKEYEVGENVVSPAVDFEFELKAGQAVTEEGKQPVLAGVEGLLKLDEEGKLSFEETTGQANLENSLELVVDSEKLAETAPGIYRYTVNEKAGSVEGLTYDEKEYTVDLYVYLNEEGAKAYKYVISGEEDAKTDLAFSNVYAHENEGGLLHNLTVAKTVTGNLGDQNKEFNFTITIKPDETIAGQKFIAKKGDQEFTIGDENGNYTLELKLKHGESVVVYGLSENDKYTVLETESGKDGYTTTGEVKDQTAMGTEDVTVTVINKANQEIPTGIIENIAPFALVLVAAVAFGFVYFKKRSVEA